MRGYIAKITAFAVMAAMLISVVPFAGMTAFAASFNANEMIEAENGTISNSTASTLNDPDASGGVCMTLSKNWPSGRPATLPDGTVGDIVYTFNVSKADVYNVWMKVYYADPNGSDDSIWAAIDKTGYGGGIFFDAGKRGAYSWNKVITGKTLGVGEHTLDLCCRENGIRIDQVMITNDDSLIPIDYNAMTAKYVAAPAEVKTGIYPDLFNTTTSAYPLTIPKFEAGDRVAFIGDSITHGGWYHSWILNYYATRYPESNFTYINLGINGDSVQNLINRLSTDITPNTFNKVVIMIGMNDMQRGEYFAGREIIPTPEGAQTRREGIISTYRSRLQNFVTSLRAAKGGSIPITIVGTTMFDEWLAWYGEGDSRNQTNKETSPTFNNVLRSNGLWLKEYTSQNGMGFVDFNTPQLNAKAYFSFGKNNSAWSMVSDRVHPDVRGHGLMGIAFVKAQGEAGEVASVDINAASNSLVKASNATVTGLTANTSSVQFTYKANALPLAADAAYRDLEKLYPMTSEMNREIFKVSGLNSGVYRLLMDGTEVSQMTHYDLDEGVNIADMAKNPGQIQSLHIKGLADGRWNEEYDYRNLKYNNGTQNPGLVSDKHVASIAMYEEKIYQDNKPKAHTVKIEYVGAYNVSASVNNSVTYQPVWLAADTVDIDGRALITPLIAKPVAGRTTFTNTGGTVLGAVPAAGSKVIAKTEVTNSNSTPQSVYAWVSVSVNNKPVAVTAKEYTLAANATTTVDPDVTIPLGITPANAKVETGIWESAGSMAPLCSKAGLPANTGLAYIRIGNDLIGGFDSAVLSYNKEYIKQPSVNPTVTAAALDHSCSVSISAVNVPGTVTITVTPPSGTAKVYTVNFSVISYTPGTVSNIVQVVPPSSGLSVTAVPSLGAPAVDLYTGKTDAERAAAVMGAGNTYNNNAYGMFSNRPINWNAAGVPAVYGYAIYFSFLDIESSILINPGVTRLYKPDRDIPDSSTEAVAAKAYEFNISKPATVVIATVGKSTFIEKQSGWQYEKDSKYILYRTETKQITYDGKDYYIPTGNAITQQDAYDGTVYKKHFNAGEKVTVPAFDTTSYRKMLVFVVWDDSRILD